MAKQCRWGDILRNISMFCVGAQIPSIYVASGESSVIMLKSGCALSSVKLSYLMLLIQLF